MNNNIEKYEDLYINHIRDMSNEFDALAIKIAFWTLGASVVLVQMLDSISSDKRLLLSWISSWLVLFINLLSFLVSIKVWYKAHEKIKRKAKDKKDEKISELEDEIKPLHFYIHFAQYASIVLIVLWAMFLVAFYHTNVW